MRNVWVVCFANDQIARRKAPLVQLSWRPRSLHPVMPTKLGSATAFLPGMAEVCEMAQNLSGSMRNAVAPCFGRFNQQGLPQKHLWFS